MKPTAAAVPSLDAGRADSDRSNAPGLIEFFRHHGVWAPGVRLFRRMQFRSKALIVSLAFVMPLLALLQLQWVTQTDALTAAHAEQDGIRYLKPLLELIKLAQARRDAAVVQLTATANLSDAMTRPAADLDALHTALGRQLDAQGQLCRLQAAPRSLAAPSLSQGRRMRPTPHTTPTSVPRSSWLRASSIAAD